MRCEVCGRKIHSEPVNAIIEGAKLTVCVECSKHGKVVYGEEAATAPSPTKSFVHIPVIMKKPPVAQVQITTEIVEDYATKIRNAREKLALSHEDLGKKINEKASLLRHIETGKTTPNNQLGKQAGTHPKNHIDGSDFRRKSHSRTCKKGIGRYDFRGPHRIG